MQQSTIRHPEFTGCFVFFDENTDGDSNKTAKYWGLSVDNKPMCYPLRRINRWPRTNCNYVLRCIESEWRKNVEDGRKFNGETILVEKLKDCIRQVLNFGIPNGILDRYLTRFIRKFL